MNNDGNNSNTVDPSASVTLIDSFCNNANNNLPILINQNSEFIKDEHLINEKQRLETEINIFEKEKKFLYLPKLSEVLNEKSIDNFVEDIYVELVDDILFGQLLQIHRAAKLGYLFYLDPDSNPEFDKQFEIYDDNDVLGVFSHLNENFKVSANSRGGQGSGSNNNLVKYECVCPNCDRNVAAIRFAPHLEKCMGMGRNSSRIATRRIANYNGDELDQLIEATGIITNHRSNAESNINVSSSTNQSKTQEDELMSIINAVATAASLPLSNNNEQINASSSSSLIDVDMSSSSSSCSITTTNNNYSNLKPPNAKKKRMQNSKSSASSTSIIQAPLISSIQNLQHNLNNSNSNSNSNSNPTNSAGSNLKSNNFY